MDSAGQEAPEKSTSKFQRHFSAEERRSVEERLNLNLYEQIRDSVADGA